jgi:hypothetical protein
MDLVDTKQSNLRAGRETGAAQRAPTRASEDM